MSNDYVTVCGTDVPRDQLQRAIDDFDGGTGEDGSLILSDDGHDDDDVGVILRGEGSIGFRNLADLEDMANGLPEFQGWEMEEHVHSKGPYEVYADGEGDIWITHDADETAVLFASLSSSG